MVIVIATAAGALQGAQDREGTAQPSDVGEELVTLQRGVAELRAAADLKDARRRARAQADARSASFLRAHRQRDVSRSMRPKPRLW